ncbi:MAG: CPBP family intramembrane metalloprotease [Clostridia bacterium]|nr:CPBP family intramembrane metalloprotease [Clostridia bacterium]
MDNNFNTNGQQNSWQVPPSYNSNGYYNYGAYVNSEYYQKLEQKKKEKKDIKTIGKNCGIGALLYLAIAYGVAFVATILATIFPSFNVVFSDKTAIFAFDSVSSILALGIPFALVFVILKNKKLMKALPYEKPENPKAAGYLTLLSIPVMVFSSIIINYISAIIQAILGVEFNSNIENTKISGVIGVLAVCISIAIVPAILEEFVVRGVALQSLRKYGDKFAILVSALFFSILHGNMLQIPYTFVGGLILGYLAVKTKSLWPPMILHFVNNFYSAIVLIVTDNFSEKAGTYVTYVIWILFILFGVFGAIGYMGNREKAPLSEGESVLTTKEKIVAFIKNGPMITMIILFGIMAINSIAF